MDATEISAAIAGKDNLGLEREEMKTKIITEFDVKIPMRDGILLDAVVVRPEEGSYPVLLSRMPYGKDAAIASGPADIMIDVPNTVRDGYVVILQDTRGHFGSEGEWDILPCMRKEIEDGEDTIKWIEAQPFCSGQVGMFGGSYLSYTQWCLMDRKLPALKAVVPSVSFSDPRDGFWYRGGAMELGLYVIWAMGFQADVLLKMGLSSEELGEAYGKLFQAMGNLPERIQELPYRNYPLFEENRLPESALEIMRSGYENKEPLAFLNADDRYKNMNVPALWIAGWYDVFLNGTLHHFQSMRQQTKAEVAENTKLVIGPWSHWSRNEWLAEGYFGTAGSAYGIELYQMHKCWFDHFLKNQDNGMEAQAPVKLFVMGENVWRDEQEWPLARTCYVPWYLDSEGNANISDGGILRKEGAKGYLPDAYLYDPSNPVETLGGTNLMSPYYEAGPKDYRKIELREDVLVYTSEELTEDMEITGPVRAKLWITSSTKDTDFVVRLLDVYPDGASMCLTDGITRARYRDYEKTGEVKLLVPGEATYLEVDMWATSNLFCKGHRIRVEVTSSCFPRWDRNTNSGGDIQTDTEADFVVARQQVLHDMEHPSCIVLPIIPRK